MKASEVIHKLQKYIERYGDLDIAVVGCFEGGTHGFSINHSSEYYGEPYTSPMMGHTFSGVDGECLLIDEV